MTEPNTSIKPSIVGYLLAQKSVDAGGKIAVRRGRQDVTRYVQKMVTGKNLGVNTYGRRIDGIVKLQRGWGR